MENTSNKDFKELKITVWCDTDCDLLYANARKSDTINILSLTDECFSNLMNAKDDLSNIVWKSREFNIPVLNRDESLTFSCLVTNSKGDEPNIYLNCEHQGLKLNADYKNITSFFGERSDLCTYWGLLIGIIAMYPIFKFISTPFWTGIILFTIGVMIMLPGFIIIKSYKFIRNFMR